MKGYIIIIFILGLGALTSYWGITSDRMARSVVESELAKEPVLAADSAEKPLIIPDEPEIVRQFHRNEFNRTIPDNLTFSLQDAGP